MHLGIAQEAVKAGGQIALQVKETRVKWGIAIERGLLLECWQRGVLF